MSIETEFPVCVAVADAPGGPGRTLFDRRRWIIPPFVLTAFVLGGATPAARLAGGFLLLGALALHMAACRRIGGASRVHARKAARRRVLVTAGPFARLRNPIYAGNILGAAGICLALGPVWFAAPALVVIALLYDRIVSWEETLLAGLYGDAYARYRDAVPRWLPAGHGVASTGSGAIVGTGTDAGTGTSAGTGTGTAMGARADGGEPRPLGKLLRRERGTLVLVAVAVVLALIRPLLGPPIG
jgi:protein-S-isoprenylcysteine O-methyltransferase Ste14